MGGMDILLTNSPDFVIVLLFWSHTTLPKTLRSTIYNYPIMQCHIITLYKKKNLGTFYYYMPYHFIWYWIKQKNKVNSMDGFFFFFGPIGTGNFRLCFQLGQMIKRRKRRRKSKNSQIGISNGGHGKRETNNIFSL